MKIKNLFILVLLITADKVFAQDTLYFRLSNPWNTVKDPGGKYVRKCVKESDHYHVWDYNNSNKLVTESFYSDTNFTTKLFCHKYFDELSGLLEQSRCYLNGRLHGYFVSFDAKGDTTGYFIYENGEAIESWSAETHKTVPAFALNEVAAEFPGGNDSWMDYLRKNLQPPDSLQNVSGKVVLKFVSNSKGTVEKVELIKGLHPILDEEAIRVVSKSPDWKPAKQNGKNVHTTITQPIYF